MPRWRRIASLAAVLLAALPAAAAAQSAGDEQYEDPFQNSGGQATPTATPEPAQPAQAPAATAAPAEPAPPAVPAAPAQAAQLPRTGWDALAPGLLGMVLLSLGVALWLRVRRAP